MPTIRRPLHALVPALLALGLAAGAGAADAADNALRMLERDAVRERVEALAPDYREWIASVAPILTEEELQAFLELGKDHQRDAFIERFWRVRDPYPDTGRNEYRDRYGAMLDEAKLLFDDLDDERARFLLLNGPPAARIELQCRDVWPAEVWYYQGTLRYREQFALVFYRRFGASKFQIWRPSDGLKALVQFSSAFSSEAAALETLRDGCRMDEFDALMTAIATARREGMTFDAFVDELKSPPEPPSEEWVATFDAYSTDLPEGAETFDAGLVLSFPSRHQSRTVVQGTVAVPVHEARATEIADAGSFNFLLTGEVLREGKLFDSFRYRFNLPTTEMVGDEIPLVFDRYLRPGDYTLILKVEDLGGERFLRIERPLAVPAVEAAPPEPADPTSARLLAEANAAISTGDDTLQLVEPRGELQTGMTRFQTLTTGSRIEEVAFLLDGDRILRKKRPPFSVELDLGTLPRMRVLEAVGYDAAGEELARDELALNAGSHRFAVRLVEPRPGREYRDSLRAEVDVQVPEGEVVERVELFRDETRVATLYQEPWTQPVVLPDPGAVAYVRAVAYLPDGNSTEDVVFVNAPDYFEEVDVQFVELYVSVTDRRGRPVEGLSEDDFTVREDGRLQQPTRFDRVDDLPIHVGVMLDVSASMDEALDTARRAALGFLESAVTAKDRAALVTFNDHPHLAVEFTNEVPSLAGGLAGLKAERGTSLYDALIFGLYYFNGVKGQRALVLLSDGKDESSRFEFEETLEYARRAGVAIYAIGIGEARSDRGARKKLEALAEETGGQAFFPDDVAELGAIYDRIQRELRSRYYLAYQSTNPSSDDEFRTVEVEVDQRGLEAKTLRGYYP